MTLKKLQLKHWQIIWEVIAFTISGILLCVYIFNPTIKCLSVLLVAEYLIAIINTVGWWRWLNTTENKTPPQKDPLHSVKQ